VDRASLTPALLVTAAHKLMQLLNQIAGRGIGLTKEKEFVNLLVQLRNRRALTTISTIRSMEYAK